MSAILKVGQTGARSVLAALGWYDPRFIVGIGRFASAHGWHLESRAMLEATLPDGWHGDGMLIQNAATPRIVEFLRAYAGRQPTVVFGGGGQLSDMDLPSVMGDNYGAGCFAAKHLLGRGYRNFVWVTFADRGKLASPRCIGFMDTLSAAGYCGAILERREKANEPGAWASRGEWLSQKLSELPKPLGAFALDDVLASDVISAALASGFRVPDDIAVVGVGNLDVVCQCATVPITSIDLNFDEIATQAAALLGRLMSGERVDKEPVIVPALGIVARASTDSLVVIHPGLSRAIAFMDAMHPRNISLGDVAEASGVSLRMLHYVFTQELRRTPAAHLLSIRLAKAKRLLVQHESRKIEEIALVCGFGSHRQMLRCFSRECGMPPKDWRESQNK